MKLYPVPVKIIRKQDGPRRPDVSVIVSLYNYARYVSECLDSLAAQTQDNLELIVVDDASKDAGVAVAEAWLDKHGERFCGHTLMAHVSNMGLSEVRNTAFAHAAAPRVFVMDTDNMLYPRAIARCMEAMSADEGSAGAYTQLEYFGERMGLGNANFWSRDLFKPRNTIDAMALVSKAAWQQVGGYDQLVVDGCEDYDFWCKFVEHDLRCTFVPEILCRYRVHGQSMLHTQTNPNMASLVLDLSVRHPWLDLTHFRNMS